MVLGIAVRLRSFRPGSTSARLCNYPRSFSLTTGAIVLDPSIPVENAQAMFETRILSLYHSFDLLAASPI